MALGEPIKLRLTPGKQAEFEREAAAQDKHLATYLRDKLEAEDDIPRQLDFMRRELAAFRHKLDDMAEVRDESKEAGLNRLSETENAALLETLLLLRTISKPEHRTFAQAELERNGIPFWQPVTRKED